MRPGFLALETGCSVPFVEGLARKVLIHWRGAAQMEQGKLTTRPSRIRHPDCSAKRKTVVPPRHPEPIDAYLRRRERRPR